ncbi:hypothetical protein FJY71_04555 [candidate division WOR-3 bacterium]|nr:hypothetical protein [candidate division WOR-3 bacterium]
MRRFGGRSTTTPRTAGDSWLLVPKWYVDSLVAAGGGFDALAFHDDSIGQDTSKNLYTRNARHSGYLICYVPIAETADVDALPVLGEGSGFLYDPRKGAFVGGFNRAGLLLPESIPPHSFRFGRNCYAEDTSVVSGGRGNFATGLHSGIVSGGSNMASGAQSFIGGGIHNSASGTRSVVAGGQADTASGNNSFVGGGLQNTALLDYSSVGGGYLNTASGVGSFVGGGLQDTASGNYSSIGGGYNNTISGEFSAIPGGHRLVVTGDSSGACGWSDGSDTVKGNSTWAFVNQRVAVCSTGARGTEKLFVKGKALATDTVRTNQAFVVDSITGVGSDIQLSVFSGRLCQNDSGDFTSVVKTTRIRAAGFTVSTAGVASNDGQPDGRIYLSSAYTVAGDTWQRAAGTWAESFLTGGVTRSADTLTVPVAGKYLITWGASADTTSMPQVIASSIWTIPSGGSAGLAGIATSGPCIFGVTPPPYGGSSANGSTVLSLAAATKVLLRVRPQTGTTQALQPAAWGTWLSVTLLH